MEAGKDYFTDKSPFTTLDQLEKARSEFAIGFGSCSFEEPVQDLKQMQWI